MADKIQQILAKFRMRIYAQAECSIKLRAHGLNDTQIKNILSMSMQTDPYSISRRYRHSITELREEVLNMKQSRKKTLKKKRGW